MSNHWPLGTLPNPRYEDPEFCTPGEMLISSAAALKSRAANAIQSWSRRATHEGQIHNPALPLRLLLATSFLHAKKAQHATIHDHPYAMMSALCHARPNAQGLVVCFYPDLSATILRSVKPGSASTSALYRFLPRPLMLPKKVSAWNGPLRTLRMGACGTGHQLYFPKTGEMVTITGEDPTVLDDEAKAIYAGILSHAMAWGKTLDAPLDVRPRAPLGLDWGEEDDRVWFVPPCLPHRAFSPEELQAFRAHMEHALTLIWGSIEPDAHGMSIAIQGGHRDHKGAYVAPPLLVKAVSKTTGQYDTTLQRRITVMVRDAIRHPKCPLPMQRLFARDLYWTASGKQEVVQLGPATVYHGQRLESEAAHKKMAAMAALGRTWTTF